MTAPTEAEIREALRNRLELVGDSYARDADWIDYLSDGLGSLWPGERLPNGDRVTTLDPELEAMIEAARPSIAKQCHELAIAELTDVARHYRDRVARRAEYRGALMGFPGNEGAAREAVEA